MEKIIDETEYTLESMLNGDLFKEDSHIEDSAHLQSGSEFDNFTEEFSNALKFIQDTEMHYSSIQSINSDSSEILKSTAESIIPFSVEVTSNEEENAVLLVKSEEEKNPNPHPFPFSFPPEKIQPPTTFVQEESIEEEEKEFDLVEFINLTVAEMREKQMLVDNDLYQRTGPGRHRKSKIILR